MGLGQVPLAVGTDTGGSIRIPSAFCGITGFKPTVGVVPGDGCHPLCQSFDSIGPMGRCVEDCAVAFRIMAGSSIEAAGLPLEALSMASLHLLVPLPWSWDRLDPPVEASFRAALAAIREAGGRVEEVPLPSLDAEWMDAFATVFSVEGAFSNAALLADPEEVGSLEEVTRCRLQRGQSVTGVSFLSEQRKLRAGAAEVDGLTRGYDAMLMPTCPIIPPLLADLHNEERIAHYSGACPRLTRLVNGLGRCAASLPCHLPAQGGDKDVAPVGLMVVGEALADEHCLRVARSVEKVLKAAGLGAPSASSAALPRKVQAGK